MQITINTNSKSFRYSFAIALLIFSFTLFGLAAYSWTGPSSSAPNGNVSAPINVGSASQTKNGSLGVNGLAVYGAGSVSGRLNVIGAANDWKIVASQGTNGIYADASNGIAVQGMTSAGGYAGYFAAGGSGGGGVFARNSNGYYAYLGYPGTAWGVYTNGNTYTAGYTRSDGGFTTTNNPSGNAGYFVAQGSNTGGVFAQNSSGYWAYLGLAGTSWSVYGNGNSYSAGYNRADGGFCIGGSCRSSWSQMGGSYWTGYMYIAAGTPSLQCASGYVVTGISTHEGDGDYRVDNLKILCTSLSP